MYEVELKVRAAHPPVRERLEAEGAERLGTRTQYDTYYDHPVRSFAATDEALRLRRERGADDEEDAILTYKGPLVDEAAKTRREVESGVEAPGAVDAVLRAVGFQPAAEVRKTRERYALSGYLVVLDAVDDLGEFVEVEAEGEASEISRLSEGTRDVCRRLGLDPDASIETSYLGMLLEAGAVDGGALEAAEE